MFSATISISHLRYTQGINISYSTCNTILQWRAYIYIYIYIYVCIYGFGCLFCQKGYVFHGLCKKRMKFCFLFQDLNTINYCKLAYMVRRSHSWVHLTFSFFSKCVHIGNNSFENVIGYCFQQQSVLHIWGTHRAYIFHIPPATPFYSDARTYIYIYICMHLWFWLLVLSKGLWFSLLVLKTYKVLFVVARLNTNN